MKDTSLGKGDEVDTDDQLCPAQAPGDTLHPFSIVHSVQSSIKDIDLLLERRETLCVVAARLFREYGYDRTTIPDLARATGMSVGSIYRYVGKKEDLLYLMLQFIAEQLEESVYPYADAPLDPWPQLKSLMSAYYRLIDRYKDHFYVALRDLRPFEDFRTHLRTQETKTLTCFAKVLSEGCARHAFADVDIDLVANNLVQVGHAWVTRSYRMTARTINDYVDGQFEFVSRALQPDT